MRSILLFSSLLYSVSAYTWKNVRIGGGGGFTPGIVFNPTEEGLAYARTDIGGLYKLNTDDSWTPLQDYANDTTWHDWGVDALATDPIDPKRLYIAVGMYTNSWDPNNGSILRSQDYGQTWESTPLPFKVGGNMPGRGMGERLAIDPQNNKIIYFGARSGNGLWKSVDQGLSFQKVDSFTAVGTYQADATDTSGYSNDINGLAAVTFDPTSPLINGATSRIYVGTADRNASTWVSNDAGETWIAMAGQPTGVFPHKMLFSTAEKALYISYNSESGPYSAGTGYVARVSTNGTFTDITPSWAAKNNITIGYGGLALDAQNPGTVMVAAMNLWAPDVQIFRSTDSGATWSTIWDYVNGAQVKYYTYDTDAAPWITASRQPGDTKILGWMVEALSINPFDPSHFLYGTGATIYSSKNTLSFPAVHISSAATGIEETSVQNLIAPPGIGSPLVSAVADIGGFVHKDLDIPPADAFETPFWSTTNALDYAGLDVKKMVRIGNGQLATSTTGGQTWSLSSAPPAGASGGSIALSADGSTVVWTSSAGSLLISLSANASSTPASTIASLPTGIAVIADKANPAYFYAASTTGIYTSSNSGQSFTLSTNLSSSSTPELAVDPLIPGSLYISTSSGIYHSSFGSSLTRLPDVSAGHAIAIGKGSGNTTNVYAFATIDGESKLRLRKGEGSWEVISTPQMGFGSSSANCLAASSEEELVFVGTNGRGIFYGRP